ncbi:MAG: hypothetical protein Q8L15_19350 [Methylobacter sp.]|nr:hypothetical protein [Methylobacter sp.]
MTVMRCYLWQKIKTGAVPYYYAQERDRKNIALTFPLMLAASASIAAPSYERVVIVVEENYCYSQIVGSSDAPFINNGGVLIANAHSGLFQRQHAPERAPHSNGKNESGNRLNLISE